MNIYLVRIAGDEHEPVANEHELVGIFAAKSLDELYIIIDETCCDPADCEFMELPSGGIAWPAPQAPAMPHPDGIEYDGSYAYYFEGAEFSMNWGIAILGDDYQPIPISPPRSANTNRRGG